MTIGEAEHTADDFPVPAPVFEPAQQPRFVDVVASLDVVDRQCSVEIEDPRDELHARGDASGAHISARNRLHGIVTEVQVEGLMAQVEIVVSDPVRLVAVVTRDAVEDLGLEPGMATTALVKSTNVILQH